ncbi:MAG: hypothetical protein M1831_003440 [Alyxoria varia]|nr:MAG: hypothetical protein M1831_003440 [Alyxoria varia]
MYCHVQTGVAKTTSLKPLIQRLNPPLRQRVEPETLSNAFVLTAPVGWIADRIPCRRFPFLIGLAVLALATALLATGKSIPSFVVGRALQGLSSAIVWISGLALLVDTVGNKCIGQYLGYVSLSMTMGMLLGPLLGGIVFAAGSGGYGGVYGMCWGLVAVDVVLRVVVVEKKVAKKWMVEEEGEGGVERTETGTGDLESGYARDHDEKDTPADAHRTAYQEHRHDSMFPDQKSEPQSATRTHPDDPSPQPASEVHRTTTPPRADSPPGSPTHLLTPSNAATAAATTALKHAFKLPPVIRLLLSPRLLIALYASLIAATLLTAFDSTLPLYVRQLFSWDSAGAGLIFLPLVLPSFLSPVVGLISDRFGPRWPAVSGLLLGIPFLTCLRFVTSNTLQHKIMLCGLLAGVGTAFTIALPPVMAEISCVVFDISERRPGVFGERGAYAQGYGLFNMAFAGGMMAGPLWGGLMKERLGWAGMGWTLAVLSGGSAIPVVMAMGGWIFTKRGRAWDRGTDGVLNEGDCGWWRKRWRS